MQAFAALAGNTKKVDEPAFQFLLAQLKNDGPPLLRLAAAKGLSQAKLSEGQLLELTKRVASAGPLEMPALLGAFEKNAAETSGPRLARCAAEKSRFHQPDPCRRGQSGQAMSRRYSPERRQARARLQIDAVKQKARLDELQPLTTGGSLEQGRDIFFGNKALCSSCHAINNKGGGVGPDLGKIGAIRSGRDLLESIVFPSASFARGFEPYVVETKQGKAYTGILARRASTRSIWPRRSGSKFALPARNRDVFARPGSIMPQGLDAGLTRRELQDLLAYLQVVALAGCASDGLTVRRLRVAANDINPATVAPSFPARTR